MGQKMCLLLAMYWFSIDEEFFAPRYKKLWKSTSWKNELYALSLKFLI